MAHTAQEPACRQIDLLNYRALVPRHPITTRFLHLAFAGAALLPSSLLATAPAASSANAPKVQQGSHSAPASTRHVDVKVDVKTEKPDASARYLDIAGFGSVAVYAPNAPVRGIALFASGDGGWNLGVREMARTAATLGYWVAGFDTPALLKTLATNDSACIDMAAALTHLGDKVKTSLNLPKAEAPLLIGYSSGATIEYAALVQAGDRRFSGAMTLGFCPDLLVQKPFCTGAGLRAHKPGGKKPGIVFDVAPTVASPWIVLQGDIDKVCNPPATIEFVHKVKNASVVELPHVGHGYGVPRNWMPQYQRGLKQLRDQNTSTTATPRDAASP